MGHRSDRFVRQTRSTFALDVAVNSAALREAAISNPALTEEQWLRCWPAKPKLPVALAKELISRPLTPAQVDHVIADGRSSLIAIALTYDPQNAPSAEQLDTLLTSKALTAKLAAELLEAFDDRISPQWLAAAADKAGGSARMELFLRDSDSFTDAQLADALAAYSTWGAEWDTERQATLLARRPGALPGAVASDFAKLRTQAAGCRHLTDPALQVAIAELDSPEAADPDTAPQDWIDERMFTWLALVNNPVVPCELVARVDPLIRRAREYDKQYSAANRLRNKPFHVAGTFEDESDPTKIAWLVRRTVPGKAKAGGRLHDLPALMANRHLSDGDTAEILRAFTDDHSLHGLPELTGPLDDLLRRFPHLASETDLTPANLTALRDEAARLANAREAPSHWVPKEDTVEEIEASRTLKLSALEYSTAAERFLEQNMPDSVAAWQFAFRMLDEQAFTGSIDELVMVATATA